MLKQRHRSIFLTSELKTTVRPSTNSLLAVEHKSQVVLTDQQIAEIISEVSELRKMYEALHTMVLSCIC